jgi:uncharacterized protein YcbX
MSMEMTIESIRVYPVKSIGPLSLSEAEVDHRGFCLDRRWLVVDENGKQPSLPLRQSMFRIKPVWQEGGLFLNAPGMTSLPLPLTAAPGFQKIKTAFNCTATLWPEICSQWFSDFLGGRYYLVHMELEDRRAVREDAGKSGDTLNFSDLSAIHILNQASLRDLNTRLIQPVSAEVFRPNLVIQSEHPYAEDEWLRLQINEVLLDTGLACPRCSMTLADPHSGEANPDKEPLKTLATYRKAANNQINFGHYFAVRKPGWIRKGDRVVSFTR